MKVWSTLSTLALAGAMFASPVAAGHPEGERSWLPDSPSPQERKLDAAQVPPGRSIEGQVAAIDRDTGRMILDTLEGPISLTAAPEDLDGIEVGDMVRISLATDTRL